MHILCVIYHVLSKNGKQISQEFLITTSYMPENNLLSFNYTVFKLNETVPQGSGVSSHVIFLIPKYYFKCSLKLLFLLTYFIIMFPKLGNNNNNQYQILVQRLDSYFNLFFIIIYH